MCDLYIRYNILPEFRTKVEVRHIHGCDIYMSNYGTSLVTSSGRRGAITDLQITSHEYLVYSVFCSR